MNEATDWYYFRRARPNLCGHNQYKEVYLPCRRRVSATRKSVSRTERRVLRTARRLRGGRESPHLYWARQPLGRRVTTEHGVLTDFGAS